MSDEIKTEEKECKCFCRSEGFRKFLIIALGTFVGVYCALSLFAALHRPPMMPPMHGPYGFGGMRGCPQQMMHHHNFVKPGRFDRGDFKQIPPKDFGKKAPFEARRAEIND